MGITRRLMKPGTFSLKLQPNTPYKIHSAVYRYDTLVVTPTRLYPIDGFSNANVLAQAIYSGVITKTPSPTELAGHGLEWYLGTPKGYGPGTAATQGLLTNAVTGTTATLSTWVSALCPPALTVGTVTNGALPTLTDSFQMVTRREALDAVCRQIGAEYRVNPSGTIDAAVSTTLFGATPDVVITRKPEGRDGGYWGLEGSTIVKSTDVDDYISKAIVVTRGEGSAATATTTSGTASFRDFAGNTMHVERYIDAPTALAANAGLIGTAAISKFNAERRDLRLSSSTYAIDRMATPGDYVYVYDPVAGLVDSANQISFRGETMSPLMLRVFGLTYPIERGMGVYARRATGVGTYAYTDLSDWVVWEDGEVQWEVGAARRPLVGTNAAMSETSVAYLGENPAVAARVAATAGYVARAATGTSQGGITSITNLTDLSVSFTAPSGRRYKITCLGYPSSTVATDLLIGHIRDASDVNIGRWAQCPGQVAGAASLQTGTLVVTPAAGAVTYKMALERNSGTGTVTSNASSSSEAFILVEDIGPA